MASRPLPEGRGKDCKRFARNEAARDKWIEAGKVLSENPRAIVRCPERDDGVLLVHDEAAPDGSAIERYLFCKGCGARNIILIRREIPS